MSKPKPPDLAARMEKHIASPDYKGFPNLMAQDTRTPSTPAPTPSSAHDPTVPEAPAPTSPPTLAPTSPRDPAPLAPPAPTPPIPHSPVPTASSTHTDQHPPEPDPTPPQPHDPMGAGRLDPSRAGEPAPTSPHIQDLKAQALDPARWQEATRTAERAIPPEPQHEPTRAYVRATRINMKRSCTYLHPVCKEQIEAITYAKGLTEEDILRTGLNLYFKSVGLPENAFLGRPEKRGSALAESDDQP